MDTQHQADRLRIIVTIRILCDVCFDVYSACVLSLRITFILGEKVGNSRVGERHLRDILVGEGGEKEIVEGEDEQAWRRKTYVKIVCA